MNKFYSFAMHTVKALFPLWYKIETSGTENLPQTGGYLFVSNHRSMADAVLVAIQNPKAQFCFLAKQELFEHGFVGWLLRHLGAIAIDRGAGDISPVNELIERLKNGDHALIFPEGTRSKDGKLGKFKTGAALVAAQTGVPIVPVGISFEGSKLHFRSKITVRYGAPMQISCTSPDDPRPAELKQIKLAMTAAVTNLLPAEQPLLTTEQTDV